MCLRIWIWSIIKISFKYPVSSWLYENSLAEDCIWLCMPHAFCWAVILFFKQFIITEIHKQLGCSGKRSVTAVAQGQL